MSAALPMLFGGLLFLVVWWTWGIEGITALALALFAMELLYDLRRYRNTDG